MNNSCNCDAGGIPAHAGLYWRGIWQTGVTYFPGHLVAHEEQLYVCIQMNASSAPVANSMFWEGPVAQGEVGQGVPVGGGAGQVLAKNSATDHDTTWVDVADVAPALADLTDVTLTAPTDDQLLAFDDVSGQWINQSASAAGVAVAGHDHDASYAGLGHDHNAAYAALGHDHDAAYAALGHDHAGVYEPANGNIQAHIIDTGNPHGVTKAQVGLGNVADLKVTLDAVVAPGVNDDSSNGYAPGSRWVDLLSAKEYVCVDASVGAALWRETTATGGGGGSGMLGFANYSGWADDEIKTLTLSTPADGIGKAQVAVYEEVADTNLSNSDWDIVANETGWSSRDHAPAVSLTPAAVSGYRVALTLGSGSWDESDAGKRIVNRSVGETGEAVILWASGAVATAKVTTAFTDTNAIASGDWALYGSEFSNTSPGEVSVSGVNRGGGIDNHVTFLLQSESSHGSTSFADSSRSDKVVTAYGTVMHSTDQAKFGASSIGFPGGTGESYLSVADDVGNQLSRTGPWTLDLWFRPLSSQPHTLFNKKFYAAGVNGGWMANVNNTGSNGTHSMCISCSNGTTFTTYASNSNLTIAVGSWYHVEIANTGDGALVFFLNGVQVGTNTIDAAYVLDVSGHPLVVGSNVASTTPPYGWMEEVRISKGIVRHTGNFTPPAAPYSDAAQYTNWVAVLSDADQIDTTSYLDWNSTSVTQTLNSQESAFAFSTDGRASFVVMNNAQSPALRTIVSSKAADHGGSEGDWYVNTNATYTGVTWSAATVNAMHAALEQAMATTANKMDKTQLEAVSDANHPAFGSTLDCAILLKTTSLAATPKVDAVSFNYDGNVRHLLKTGSYEVEMTAVNQVKVKAPASGGPRSARVYVSA